MDVTKNNFADLLPQITKDIDNCQFVSIDTEFTGIARDLNLFDTYEERYKKMRNCSQYSVIQYGLSTFFYSSEDLYKCQSYNFYIFPHKVNGAPKENDRDFLIRSSSFEFLSTHGFDFNRWIKEGISYATLKEEESFKDFLSKKKSQKNEPITLDNSNTIDKDFASYVNEEVKKFIEDNEKDKLDLMPCSSSRIKFIYNSVKSLHTNLRLSTHQVLPDTSQRFVSIEKVTQNDIENDENNLIINTVGFSLVVQHLIKSKKPIIGHNVFVDIMYTIHHFIEPLPESYSEFKFMVKELFPSIYDTKLIASSSDLTHLIRFTALNDLYNRIKKEPFGIDVKLTNKDDTIDSTYHAAGYDSYITGVSFINLVYYFQKMKKCSSLHIELDYVKDYCGLLHFQYSLDINHFNILNDEFLPSRKHVFYVSFPAEWKTSDLNTLFSPFGKISIGWINDTSAFVSLKNSSQFSFVKEKLAFKESEEYHVIPYEDYINKSESRLSTKRKCEAILENQSPKNRSEIVNPQAKKLFTVSNDW